MVKIICSALIGVLTMAGPGDAAEKSKTRTNELHLVSFEIRREADGKKYPNPVNERYSLENGKLRYSAYFSGMPMEWNHNDGLDWRAGESGAKLLEAIGAALRDPALSKDFKQRKDDESEPWGESGIYWIETRAGTNFYLTDSKTNGWSVVSRAFAELIAQFEKATGRPLKPEQLPQR